MLASLHRTRRLKRRNKDHCDEFHDLAEQIASTRSLSKHWGTKTGVGGREERREEERRKATSM